MTVATFDFDMPVERAGGDSIKWARYVGRDVIPLWIADMDFPAPPAVIKAVQDRLQQGTLGYNLATGAQADAVVSYLQQHFDWTIQPEWIVWLPGLVSGINIACRAIGEEGSAVFTATPIYPPFLSAPGFSGRKSVSVPLIQDSYGWLWDFPAVDAVLRDSNARLFLLCHPHNPTGRVWNEDELRQMAALAEKYDLVVCSDEIHAGLVLDPTLRHRPYASLSSEIAARSITLMAPSKTYNIPGLAAAFAVIPDSTLRRQFHQAMQGIVPHVNVLGMTALQSALTECDEWQRALLNYLRDNLRVVERAVSSVPTLQMSTVDATYLAWIDARDLCRARGIENPAAYFEAHGLGLSDGADFGAAGFVRLNFGTRRALLDEALERLVAASKA
jgi:cystathionine beta-lyase